MRIIQYSITYKKECHVEKKVIIKLFQQVYIIILNIRQLKCTLMISIWSKHNLFTILSRTQMPKSIPLSFIIKQNVTTEKHQGEKFINLWIERDGHRWNILAPFHWHSLNLPVQWEIQPTSIQWRPAEFRTP